MWHPSMSRWLSDSHTAAVTVYVRIACAIHGRGQTCSKCKSYSKYTCNESVVSTCKVKCRVLKKSPASGPLLRRCTARVSSPHIDRVYIFITNNAVMRFCSSVEVQFECWSSQSITSFGQSQLHGLLNYIGRCMYIRCQPFNSVA